MDLSNKTVVVTGASRGIGRAIAQAYRDQGAWVIGTHTANTPTDAPCQQWIVADFTDMDQIVACADMLRGLEVDVLVNNAGINKNAPFVEILPAQFCAIQQVNLTAPFLLCQAVIPAMAARRWGRIVNLCSIWSKVSMAHRAAYSASKFALDGLTVALAAEHAVDGILANSVSPGFIDTELTHRMLGDAGIKTLVAKVPADRLGTVDEVAKLALWLGSGANTFISGQNIAIDGGFTRV